MKPETKTAMVHLKTGKYLTIKYDEMIRNEDGKLLGFYRLSPGFKVPIATFIADAIACVIHDIYDEYINFDVYDD